MSESILELTDANFDDEIKAVNNGVRGVPTLLVFKNGELVGRHTGFMGKSDLETFVDQYL